MLLLGGGLFFGKRKGSMTAKALALGFACSVLLLGGSVAEAANAEMTVSMEQPESAVQTTNFKVGFVALDISERTLTVKCYANGVLYDTHTTIAGGSSGDCQVNSTAMPTEGTYDFYVTAEAEEAPLVTSNHESVTFVSGGPGKPHNYERDDSACRDKITFRTDDDGGRTVGVEVYRSTNKTFTADTPVATLAIGSNTNGEIVVFPPDCNEDYYYAIRAVDASGFGSGFVGDKDIDVTIKNKNQTITLPGTANQGGALPVATEGNAQGGVEVQGAVTGDENGQVLGEATENQEGMGGSFLGWIRNHKLLSTILALLILAGGYWLFLYYRKPRRALPHV
jgi:hypothetical protein